MVSCLGCSMVAMRCHTCNGSYIHTSLCQLEHLIYCLAFSFYQIHASLISLLATNFLPQSRIYDTILVSISINYICNMMIKGNFTYVLPHSLFFYHSQYIAQLFWNSQTRRSKKESSLVWPLSVKLLVSWKSRNYVSERISRPNIPLTCLTLLLTLGKH